MVMHVILMMVGSKFSFPNEMPRRVKPTREPKWQAKPIRARIPSCPNRTMYTEVTNQVVQRSTKYAMKMYRVDSSVMGLAEENTVRLATNQRS